MGVVVAVAVVAGAIFMVKGGGKHRANAAEFQKGIGYVTWSKAGYRSPSSDKSLAMVKEVGSNYVSILVTWYQTTTYSADIHRTEKTPSDEAVLHAIQTAHDLGLKVMLKLHLDLLDKSDGSWRGEIACIESEQWNKWFKDLHRLSLVLRKDRRSRKC